MEDKRVCKTGGAELSPWYETRFGQRWNEAGVTGAQDNPKKGGYRLGTEIERSKDLRKVLEERKSLTARWNCR